ncbi:MAG: hypothetical protein WA699_12990 [Pseudolabrys sp.]
MRRRSWHTGKTTGHAPLNRAQIFNDRVFVGVAQATQLAHDELALSAALTRGVLALINQQ